MAQCLRLAREALPSFFEHAHIDTPRKWIAQKTSGTALGRPRSLEPATVLALVDIVSQRLQQSVLWRRSVGRTPELALGITERRLPLLQCDHLGTPPRNPTASSGRSGPQQRHGHSKNGAHRRSSGH